MIHRQLEWLDFGLRFGVAVIFAWAGVAKLVHMHAFRQTVGDFGLVFDFLVPAVALLLPILELLVAVAILLDTRGGRLAALALAMAFVGVTGYGLWLGLDIECGCFGPGDQPGAGDDLRLALVRSMVMAVVCAYLYVCSRRARLAARG